MEGEWLFTTAQNKIYYVHLLEVFGLGESEEPTGQQLLITWVRCLCVDIQDQDYMSIVPKFTKQYLTANIDAEVVDGSTSTWFLWQEVAKLEKNDPPNMIELSQNPELFNDSWTQFKYTMVGNLVYFILFKLNNQENFETDWQKICLACFRIDSHQGRSSKISATQFYLNEQELALVPRILDHRCQKLSLYTSLICIKGRMFAFSNISDRKFCMRIHCFYRSQILLIGGGDTVMMPGTYALGGLAEFITVIRNGRTRGYFGSQRAPSRNPQQDTLTVFRYILS